MQKNAILFFMQMFSVFKGALHWFFITRNTKYGIELESVEAMFFGVWPILQTKSLDISASAIPILTILFVNLSLQNPPPLWKRNTKMLDSPFKLGYFHPHMDK